MKLKKNNKIILLAILLIIGIFFSYNKIINYYKEYHKKELKDENYLFNHISIRRDNSLGKDIYIVKKPKDSYIYNDTYREIVDDKLRKLLEKKYEIDKPLLILNPYGTNKTSLNIYFRTKEKVKVEYTIKSKGYNDYTKTLKNESDNNLTRNHAYQIIGLIAEHKNKIELKIKDKNDKVIKKKTINVDLTNVKSAAKIKLKVIKGNSKEELTDGLFVMFGHDKNYNANNYLYDNNGILRAELCLTGYRSDRIIFKDDKLIYSYSSDGIAIVNRLGRVEKTYRIKGYKMHHDYILDNENNKLLILVNKKNTDTIEDKVLSLDLASGEYKEIIDMKDYLKEMKKTAISPKEGNTYGTDELDWIHLNSLSLINNKDIVLSSRELSTIIYMSDIYYKPKIKYMISHESMYENTNYKNLLYKKIGNFTNQAGQHTITYLADDSLSKGQYYLYMFNNNYGASRTRPSYDWKNYKGVGDYLHGDKSMLYKYLIDENNKTYELKEKIDLPYSSIVSSTEYYKNNLVTSSGMSHVFGEYDNKGKVIKEYHYTSKKYAYRVFKYDFINTWFK